MQAASIEPQRRARRLGYRSALCLSLAALSCGGGEFRSEATAGGGPTGGSEASAGAGQGGDDAGGGVASAGANTSGSSGTGASPGDLGGAGGADTACACGAGQYCRDGSNDCFRCADFARLRFRAPEKLATLSDAGAGTLRFPRVGSTRADLFYRSGALGSETISYTSDFSTSAGAAIDPNLPVQGAALLLTELVTGLGEGADRRFNFAFDREVDAVTHRRRPMFGHWTSSLQTSYFAPEPYGSATSSDFGLAIASAPTQARAYWLTDRLLVGGLRLVTAPLSEPAVVAPVNLRVAEQSCVAEPLDLTPWITPDGTALLFNHPRLDELCADEQVGTDLYIALMDEVDGQPKGVALPLSDVNGPANDTDPSFSRDACELYFASDRGGDGFDLYRAQRR